MLSFSVLLLGIPTITTHFKGHPSSWHVFFQRFLIFKSFHVCIYLLLPDAFFSREMAAVVASSFNVIWTKTWVSTFNVTQFKDVFRNGQDTQFWPLQLTEDLIFNHTPTKSIFVKLRENTFLGMSMVRARSRQGCIRRGDRCDPGRT